MNAVVHIKQSDLLIFNEVFQQYHEKLYFYVFSKTKSAFCAEEVVQLTFIKLWQYRASLNEDISIDAQIFRIAKTTLIDQLRKRNSYFNLSVASKNRTEPESNQALTNFDLQELQQKLQTALSHMPPMRRRIFALSRLQGLSYREIATRLSISEKTVENHISHALKQLRQYFPLAFLLICLLEK